MVTAADICLRTWIWSAGFLYDGFLPSVFLYDVSTSKFTQFCNALMVTFWTVAFKILRSDNQNFLAFQALIGVSGRFETYS